MSDRRMETGKAEAKKPIRVLLLDDRQDNLILRAAILRSHGYEAVTSSSVEEAEAHLSNIDIAVLDYHLGAGKFGTEVAPVQFMGQPAPQGAPTTPAPPPESGNEPPSGGFSG